MNKKLLFFALWQRERGSPDGQIIVMDKSKLSNGGMSEHTKRINEVAGILSTAKKLHFAGAGGISMSSLALWAKGRGYIVSGSDRSPSALTEMLEKNGIAVAIGQSAENVDGADAVIFSVALHPDNPELVAAVGQGIPCLTRAEFLGYMMSFYRVRIGISGTHGKSTTTAMISHILIEAGADPTVACGAVMPELRGASRIGADHNIFVYEACEYRDSFLSFCPTDAVITNVELDHTDYFADIDQIIDSFGKSIENASTVYINADNEGARRATAHFDGKIVTVSLSDPTADYSAADLVYRHGCGCYTLLHKGEPVCCISLPLIGGFNVYNSLCAAAVCLGHSVPPALVASALSSFGGVARRFEHKGERDGVAVYDDYAHHPDEVLATLRSLPALGYRHMYLVFQPHTYTRTHDLWDRWVAAFNEAKELSVRVILADIYAARETDDLGVSSEKLAKECGALWLPDFESISRYLKENAKAGDLILTMGAGQAYVAGDLFLGR